MKLKKAIAVTVALVVLIGAAVGGICGYKSYQEKNLVAEVQPVSYINWGYWGDSETSYGMVTNDSSQEIYLSDSRTVKEVFVEEGDYVEVGDPLLEYDTATLRIDIERKKLDINTIENNIARENGRLRLLSGETPVNRETPKLDEGKLAYYEALDEANKMTETDGKDSRIYNYLTPGAIPFNVTVDPATGELVYPDGTEDDPYIFCCNPNAYAYGSFFNSIRAKADGTPGIYARFIVCKKDENGRVVVEQNEEGVSVPVVDESVTAHTADLNGSNIPADYETDRMWYVFSGKEYIPTSMAQEYLDAFQEFMSEWEMPEGYTEEEIHAEYLEIQNELKALDIQRRQQLLQLESMQKSVGDGIVYAEVAGEVKTVGDPDTYQNDGTAFLVVTGDEGLYVSGTISELLLEDVTVGTVVTANSWESGMTFEATITEISDYPTQGNSWGDGNPNVSYYAYTAYIEDSSALRNGEYVDLSISKNQSETGGFYIDKAYVRQEDGKYYCMIADENGRLKKQYVVTGRTIYGSAIEIKSGLTEEDLIAFPYGKNAVEGAAVEEASNMYYY